MRTCPSCGRENPDSRDFCECGEYLRWELTRSVQAVGAGGGAAPTSTANPNDTVAPVSDTADTAGAADAPDGAHLTEPASPRGPGAEEGQAAPIAEAPPEVASLLLRLPDQEGVAEGPLRVEVQPGARVALVAVIRNQGTIVDNYDLFVDGLPREWWTLAPATVYLTPMRSGRNFEQEVQLYLHPPRTPEAVARPWTFDVVATSRTYGGEVARAGGSLLVLPYREVDSKLRPDRASGRLKARFVLTVHNRANAPAEVALDATDTDSECSFRFAEPSVTLHPGQGVEAPLTVFPPKQIWLGRSRERRIEVSAVPPDADKPPPPQSGIYRQRPWLPWWLAIVAPIVVLAVILLLLLLPKHTSVPNLKQAASVFAAQKLLNQAGLKLSAKPPEQVSAPGAKPGAIVGQTPAAGKQVKKGSEVTIVLAAGSGLAKVPSLVGETGAAAYTTLQKQGLTLGAISPQPVDPAGVIASSIPAAGASAPAGSAVSVFLATSPGLAKKLALGKGAGPAAALAAQQAAAKLAGGKHNVKIPALSGAPSVAAAKLSQLGLVPVLTERPSSKPAHTLIGSEPPAGTSVAPGSTVKLVVSSGPPEVAVDNGHQIQIVNAASGKVVKATPPFAAGELEASWSPDGSHLVLVRGSQLFLAEPNGSGWRESELTPASSEARDPAFAPQAGSHAVAYIERKGSQPQLCFATIGSGPLAPECTTPPAGWEIGHQLAWSPDGRSILVFASQLPKHTRFGLVRFRSPVPFSTHAADWGHGAVVTNVTLENEGVLAGAVSPNGSQLAAIANFGGRGFQLYLTSAEDFMLAKATPLPVAACEVVWRGDGGALALTESNSACSEPVGSVVTLEPKSLAQTPIATGAEHPAWKPGRQGG